MIWLLTLTCFSLASLQDGNFVLGQNTGCPQKCKDVPLEISFVIDASSSIWKKNFTEGLWFVQNFVDKFSIGPDKVRVSVVTYGHRVYTEDVINFNTYNDKNDLNKAIVSLQHRAGGQTHTGEAIRYALDRQIPQARTGVRKVLIVLTDGGSQQPDVTKAEAHRAHEKGMEVFAIGIGLKISLEELKNIASDGSHVFAVDTYSVLNHILNVLGYEVCGVIPNPVCKFDPVDIIFVIDSSVSVGQENFTLGLEFIKDFIENFEINPRSVRVAGVMFGARVYAESAIPFDAYTNKKGTVDAILSLEWQYGNRTLTGDGINYMVDHFLPKTRPNASHVGIVITDGESQDKKKTAEAAEHARMKGVKMFAVGVGTLGTTLDEKELNNIAGDPDRVFTTEDYARLNLIMEELIKKTCSRIQTRHQDTSMPCSPRRENCSL